ncbi:MAG: Glycosyl transferase group 1 [Candidatus Woesebacteria bacterium GW2011_GWA1_39_21]|uniref:Glycosyl transferase group 1 n=1 Tax=Candidatus Woesebacteria bacterium GW2011_GWA1_39_21 TaxID=1618550 RepID=A0A0G0N5H4_9BACT|nr:MAG: Glycosyl transferase group 1 [Candidatus Woesebacteria bacterium GW2011_GWA1_39_21]
MRVAIDSGPLTGGHSVRGVGVSVRGLIDALHKFNTDKNVVVEAVDFFQADLNDFDILHYTSFNPYFLNIPRIGFAGKKVILTIHDLIPLLYRNHYRQGIRGAVKFLINKLLVGQVDKVISVSETSKKDIVRFLGINEKKVEVIYWGVDLRFRKINDKEKLAKVAKVYRLPNKFILYVGDVNYNKNLSTLVEASRIVKLPLVIVGKQAAAIDELIKNNLSRQSGFRDKAREILGITHPEIAHLTELLYRINSNRVLTTGFVPANDLVAIMNLASVYCQPSYYEGFGLPVLEAFACETPVVISKTQALVEIAGGSAAVAKPNSAGDFANKISFSLKDSSDRLRMIRAGSKRVKQFTWRETAEKTVKLYKSLSEI